MFWAFWKQKDEGIFQEILLNVSGHLYASPMPYGAYDTQNRLLKVYVKNKVDRAIILATDDEIDKKCKRNLKKLYEKNGIAFDQYPMKDLQTPSLDVLDKAIPEIVNHLTTEKVVIHCHAGVGRTGVVICCLTRYIEKLAPDYAIKYVKSYIKTDMTTSQKDLVMRWECPVPPEEGYTGEK